jgi:hypothetical protein
MKQFLKKIFEHLGLLEIAALILTYSPLQLLRALQAREKYKLYYQQAQSKYPHSQRTNSTLNDKGVAIIQNAIPLDLTILNSIRNAFKSNKVISYSFGRYEKGFINNAEYYYLTKEAILESNIINASLESGIIQQLEEHLGTFVRIVNYCVFKNISQSYTNRGSFIWHRDSQPMNSYKLIVYLTDTNEINGAFQYLEESHLTYKNLPQFGNSRLRSLPVDSGTIYPGKIGDGILFNINGYHLGGRVLAGERIVAVIHFKPSITPCREHFNKFGFGSVTEQEFGPNPWQAWWAWPA